MVRSSRKHLVEAEENYFQHLRFAMVVGMLTVAAGLACIIHALVPALCQRTCSRTIGQLHHLFGSRDQWRSVQQDGSGALVFVMLILLASATTLLPLIAGGPPLAVAMMAVMAFALPLTFLLTNPDLEMIED